MYNSKLNKFTMIEILVVIAIIGIMATMLIGTFSGGVDKSKVSEAKADMAAYVAAKISNEAAGTAVTALPKDPWDNNYTVLPGDNFNDYKVMSNGADGEMDGDGLDSSTAKNRDNVYSWK